MCQRRAPGGDGGDFGGNGAEAPQWYLVYTLVLHRRTTGYYLDPVSAFPSGSCGSVCPPDPPDAHCLVFRPRGRATRRTGTGAPPFARQGAEHRGKMHLCLFLTMLCTLLERVVGESEVCSTEALSSSEVREMRDSVLAAMEHTWSAYEAFAWGSDELRPLSRRGKNWTQSHSLGITLIDSLDTLHIMGMRRAFERAKRWLRDQLSFESDSFVNLFETSIRVLGGLLAGYHLDGDPIFLEKAKDLGDRLLPSFASKSGVPYSDVNLKTGHAEEAMHHGSLSEVTSIQLEFKVLSNFTGDAKYAVAAESAMAAVRSAMRKLALPVQYIPPMHISARTGRFTGSTVTLGARGDSYYEYLLKQWVLSGRHDEGYLDWYRNAIDQVRAKLMRTSPGGLSYIGELNNNNVNNKMDHLVCFLPGTLALGVMTGAGGADDRDMAAGLTESCFRMYNSTASGLGPEIAYFRDSADGKVAAKLKTASDDIYIKAQDAHYLLRPELLESLFYMHRLTRDDRYRRYAWEVFQAIERHCRVESGGFASVNGVNNAVPTKRDDLPSYFTAETLKYLYLIFSDDEQIDVVHGAVLNTEAHVLPILH